MNRRDLFDTTHGHVDDDGFMFPVLYNMTNIPFLITNHDVKNSTDAQFP